MDRLLFKSSDPGVPVVFVFFHYRNLNFSDSAARWSLVSTLLALNFEVLAHSFHRTNLFQHFYPPSLVLLFGNFSSLLLPRYVES